MNFLTISADKSDPRACAQLINLDAVMWFDILGEDRISITFVNGQTKYYQRERARHLIGLLNK